MCNSCFSPLIVITRLVGSFEAETVNVLPERSSNELTVAPETAMEALAPLHLKLSELMVAFPLPFPPELEQMSHVPPPDDGGGDGL